MRDTWLTIWSAILCCSFHLLRTWKCRLPLLSVFGINLDRWAGNLAKQTHFQDSKTVSNYELLFDLEVTASNICNLHDFPGTNGVTDMIGL
jgi:hypothetical protein